MCRKNENANFAWQDEMLRRNNTRNKPSHGSKRRTKADGRLVHSCCRRRMATLAVRSGNSSPSSRPVHESIFLPAHNDKGGLLGELARIAATRDGAALDRVAYWDTGSPSYRWSEIAVAEHLRTGDSLADCNTQSGADAPG
jgi:hypothetical protein